MASEASHALEAALEQMDGIIAGAGRGVGDQWLVLHVAGTACSHFTFLCSPERSSLLELLYFIVHAIAFLKGTNF